jgi:hypothetical protein
MTTIYVILFIAVFPALWLLAAYLDRVWPSDINRPARRVRHREEDEEARTALHDFMHRTNRGPGSDS